MDNLLVYGGIFGWDPAGYIWSRAGEARAAGLTAFPKEHSVPDRCLQAAVRPQAITLPQGKSLTERHIREAADCRDSMSAPHVPAHSYTHHFPREAGNAMVHSRTQRKPIPT